MVRQTIAILGEPEDAAAKIVIDEKVVDIFKEEQFAEHFLCEINPEGQVRIPPAG